MSLCFIYLKEIESIVVVVSVIFFLNAIDYLGMETCQVWVILNPYPLLNLVPNLARNPSSFHHVITRWVSGKPMGFASMPAPNTVGYLLGSSKV